MRVSCPCIYSSYVFIVVEGLLICNDWQMDRMQYRWTQGVKTLFTQCDATVFPDLYLSEEVILSSSKYNRLSIQSIHSLFVKSCREKLIEK